MVWWLWQACAEETGGPDLDDLEWAAAAGTLSDLGGRAPFAFLRRAKKRFTAKWLREATRLINASRRSAGHDVDTALQVVLGADHPREAASEETPEGARLWAYRREAKAASAAAAREMYEFLATQERGHFDLLMANYEAMVHYGGWAD